MKQVKAVIIDNYSFSLEPGQSGYRVLLGFQLMWLHCPQIAREARPGQFVMVRCGEECTLSRPFSVHQVNKKGDMALWFAVWEGGKGTHWLSQRKAGDSIDLLGPLGNGYSINSHSQNLLLLAGGVGIAPLYFLAQEGLKQGCSVKMLHGTSTAANLYPKDMPDGVDTHLFVERGSGGQEGMITDFLPEYIDQADQVFACGPIAMYKGMYEQREKLLKTKPVQVSLEVRMGCGFGVCYGCTVKTKNGLKQVCKDGPVFDLDDVLWNGLELL